MEKFCFRIILQKMEQESISMITPTVVFNKNSNVAFIQNAAVNSGGAIFLRNRSVCLFDHNSIVTFNNNNATYGTIYNEVNCNVTFTSDQLVK